MEFLGTLHLDVKLLLVGGALALLGGLFSGSKRNEHRYMAVFTVLMIAAGVRFHFERQQDEAQAQATPAATSKVKGAKAGSH